MVVTVGSSSPAGLEGSSDVSDTGGPVGGLPATVAEFENVPASISS